MFTPPSLSTLFTRKRISLMCMVLGEIPAMFFRMSRPGKGYQVLRPIVLSVAVYMVNMLARCKQSAMRFFPNQSVLKDIAVGIGKRMVRSMDIIILPMLIAASLPLRMCGYLFAPHVMSTDKWHSPSKIAGLAICIAIRNRIPTTTRAQSIVRNNVLGGLPMRHVHSPG